MIRRESELGNSSFQRLIFYAKLVDGSIKKNHPEIWGNGLKPPAITSNSRGIPEKMNGWFTTHPIEIRVQSFSSSTSNDFGGIFHAGKIFRSSSFNKGASKIHFEVVLFCFLWDFLPLPSTTVVRYGNPVRF